MRHWKLEYSKPAASWTEAMPLGNGKLGAMIYGRENEKVSLNLSTLWSGVGSEKGNKTEHPDWNAIRQAIFEEEYQKAEEMIKATVLGDWTEAYLPAANLHLEIEQPKATGTSYSRELDISEAVYRDSSDTISKEAFVDFKHNVFTLCLTCKGEETLSFSACLDSQLQYKIVDSEQTDSLRLQGKAPVYAAPDYYQCENPIRYSKEGMEFEMGLKIKVWGGEVKREENKLVVSGAQKAVLYVAGNTNFSGGAEPVLLKDDAWRAVADQYLASAWEDDYENAKDNNISYYQSFFNRLELELGECEVEAKDTDQRVKDFQKENNDTYLMALMFHYGRYLFISSSAADGECGNLQGLWNESMRAPWSSNYTVNINTQMNNWPVESCNLSELHIPMFGLMKRTAKRGAVTAKKLYGAEGWVSHHNIDIWGHSTPVGYNAPDSGSCVYSMWNMSSGWMCRHLWEHYCYTLDKEFLEKDAYPLVEGAVAFYLDYLVEKDGLLLTVPSTSPENTFLDKNRDVHSVTISSTMDIAVLKEIFAYYIEMCDILGKDKNVERCKQALEKLPEYQIGKHGQLQEWYLDYDEADVNHRHVSHLYGLYPSNTIRESDEKLRKACKTVLERRGHEGTGWCIAWKAALWARLKEGEKVFELLENQLRFTDVEHISMKGGGTYANLFCAHPPFQIDGNFGYMAAVAEALLQSHEGKIELIPALPEKWNKGKVKGMKARGGYTVDFSWENGQVTAVKVEAMKAGSVTLSYNGKTEELIFTEDRKRIEKS